jgi:L-aspartate oxidase
VHGANRLASNSLLEGVVFSDRAASHAADYLRGRGGAETMPEYPFWNKEGTFDLQEWVLVQHNMEEVKRLMWDYVGIVRSDRRLKSAHKRVMLLGEDIHECYRKSTISPEIVELRNLATIANLIIKGAMTRKNSIGLHYNTDHPETGIRRGIIIQQSGRRPARVKT